MIRRLARAAVVLAPSCLASCLPLSKQDARRIEVLAAIRNPDDRLGHGDESHNVFGATLLVDAETPGLAGELGVRAADFESDGGDGSWFLELHAGARYTLLQRSPVRPFIGLGVMAAFGEDTDLDEGETYVDPYDAIHVPGGLYTCAGLDLCLGRAVLSLAARAALADGIDPFARDPDDVAVDAVASAGWRF